MKIAIVLGATGLIGKALVEQLSGSQHIEKVIAVTRKPVEYSSQKIHNGVVDFENLDAYSEIFKGDMLFSTLGTTIKQAGSIANQRKVDIDYQFQAASLALSNGVAHYLLVSSSGANSDSKNAYLKMKGELEEKIKNLSFSRTSIFKPSLLLGERSDKRFLENIGSIVLPFICKLPGLTQYRPIYGHQVASKMIQTSLNDGKKYEEFILDEIFS